MRAPAPLLFLPALVLNGRRRKAEVQEREKREGRER